MGALCSLCFKKKAQEVETLSMNMVKFSPKDKGSKCIVSNFTVSGEGSVLANAALLQTKSYFEVSILEAGNFCVGVSAKGGSYEDDLKKRPLTWCMSSSSGTYKIGDVIGVSFDLSDVKPELKFFLNGKLLRKETARDVAGDVYPAVSVKDGASLQANFGQTKFAHNPPPGFEGVILSVDML